MTNFSSRLTKFSSSTTTRGPIDWFREQIDWFPEQIDWFLEQIDVFREQINVFREQIDMFRQQINVFREQIDVFARPARRTNRRSATFALDMTDQRPQVIVQRYFPTFDFVVRTEASRESVIDTLAAALDEPSTTSWPFPKPHLSGRLDGGTFRCRPRTSTFGGNAVPSARGQVIPRPGGGTDVRPEDLQTHLSGTLDPPRRRLR